MRNRLVRCRLAHRTLTPVEAEILVFADAETLTAETNLRGRLVGPMCPYSTTIEVAYPVRQLPQPLPGMPLTRRIVIPEPSFWDPVSPFLYRGSIELWEGEDMHESIPVRTGLRSVVLRPNGLKWNNRPLRLLVASRDDINPQEVPALRQRGFNTIFLDWPDPALLDAAETWGLLVLARPTTPTAEVIESTAVVACLLPSDWRRAETEWLDWMRRQRTLIGMTFDGREVPANVAFLIDGPSEDRPCLSSDGMGTIGRIGDS
jgi:hypothetical protein